MIVDYTVLKNHSVKSANRCLGVKGDHLTDILKVSLADCGFLFTKVEIRFLKQNEVEGIVINLPVNIESQTVLYPMPYTLFLESGEIDITVTAETTSGETFTSFAKYIVLDNSYSTEEIRRRYENAVLGIAKINSMRLGAEN